jgi:hypothetical protein
VVVQEEAAAAQAVAARLPAAVRASQVDPPMATVEAKAAGRPHSKASPSLDPPGTEPRWVDRSRFEQG